MTTRHKMRVTRAYISRNAIFDQYAKDVVEEMHQYFDTISKGVKFLNEHFWFKSSIPFKTKFEALEFFRKLYQMPSYEEMEMRLAIEGVKT